MILYAFTRVTRTMLRIFQTLQQRNWSMLPLSYSPLHFLFRAQGFRKACSSSLQPSCLRLVYKETLGEKLLSQ